MRSAARWAMAYMAGMRCAVSSLEGLRVSRLAIPNEIFTHRGKMEASTTRRPFVPYTLDERIRVVDK
jgi:hypothetical protein